MSDSDCFDAANQQIWVHLWGPIVMAVYYIMIIIKISTKRILIGRIFYFRRCQIILWWNLMEPFERALFGCCPSGRIPSDGYGIPTCRSNDVTRSAEQWAYPSSKSLETDANSCIKRRECLPFKITWAQISSRDAIFIFSLHAGAVVWPLLPDRDTFRRCFDLGFHDQVAASKLTTVKKERTLIFSLLNCCVPSISQTYLHVNWQTFDYSRN